MPILQSTIDPICAKLCTDKRVDTAAFKQWILQSPGRPPIVYLECDLSFALLPFSMRKVYRVFLVRSKEKQVEP